MKYVKKFNEQEEKSIEDWVNRFKMKSYVIINDDNTIDVNNNVNLKKKGISKIPIQFGIVTGNFICSRNKLISLKGSPRKVDGSFSCAMNELISLDGGPKEVGLNYYCYKNKLTSLIGLPIKIEGYFDCSYNQLLSFDHLTTSAIGKIYLENNPVYELYLVFRGSLEKYKASLDFNYFRNNYTCINRRRFELACKDVGVRMPESIPGYEFI
jgi:hypothetical protein